MSRAHPKRERGGGRRVSSSAPVAAEKYRRAPGLDLRQLFDSLSANQQLGILIAGVALLVLVIYWPALSAQATYFDDEFYLADRVSPSWEAAGRAFTEILEPTVVVGYYHPLSILSIMLDRALGGSDTNLLPFHLTSLALHLGNTLLVMVLLYVLFGRPWMAAALGLLFGIHPITVESLPWITERKTLLGSFFTLGTLILYVLYARRKDWKLYAACFIAYLLAVLSKPTSLPAPALMLLLDYWPLDTLHAQRERSEVQSKEQRAVAGVAHFQSAPHLRRYLEKAPFFIVGGVFAVIAYISQSRTASVILPTAESPWRNPLILAHNIIFYLYTFVWPFNPAPHYPFPEPFSLSQPMVLIGVIGTLVLLAVLIVSLRWTRAWLTGWLFFFIAILPAMGIIGFTPVIAADRFAYFPVVGFLLSLAWGLAGLWDRWGSSLPSNGTAMNYGRAGLLALILIVAGLEAWSTRAYLAQWQNTESLYRYALRHAPNVDVLHNNLGLALARAGRAAEAIAEYQAALQINPDYVDGHLNLGAELADQGKLDEAIAQYQIVLQLRPNSAYGHNNWGLALARQGKLEEAEAHFRAAVEIKPDYGEAHTNLAGALMQQSKLVKAMAEYEAALKINPNDVLADRNLRLVVEQKRQLDEAIRQLRAALLSQPGNVEWRLQLGDLLEQEGRFEEALVEYRKVLEIDPANIKAKQRLAVLSE